MTIIKKSPVHGIGVFANQNIPQNLIFDDILLPSGGVENNEEVLDLFYSKNGSIRFIGAEFASFLNHSEIPNIEIKKIDINKKKIYFIALRNIENEEELFINYNKYGLDTSFVKTDVPLEDNSISKEHLKGII